MLTAAPVNFIFSMYIETKIIMQGLVYATRSDGPHQQVVISISLETTNFVTTYHHLLNAQHVCHILFCQIQCA